jgi:hypothetical protein
MQSHKSTTPDDNKRRDHQRSRLWHWRTLALFLIVIGLVVMVNYGVRSVRAYREFQYIRATGLDRGTARIEAIRPWMTVRYVGVAYAVPEGYIFAHLQIAYNRRNSHATLGELNDERALVSPPVGGQEALGQERVK